MVFSASLTSRPSQSDHVFLLRHLVFLAIAGLLTILAAHVPRLWWRTLAPWLFGVTLLMLMAVLIPGVGTEVNGAHRWLRFGPLSLQPSEVAKVTLPLFLCWVIERRRAHASLAAAQPMPPLIPIAVTAFLVLQEPDLGTAVFLCGSAFLCLFLSGQRLWHFMLAGGLVVPAAAGLVALRPYQVERLRGFLRSWHDMAAAPYQMRQALATLGAGGLTGTGLGRGWQKLSFLPEANTDFVFAVLGEELGFVGTLGILVLWISLFGFGVQMLSRLRKPSFEYVLSMTLLTQLVMQAAVNIAIVTGLLPPKGIPHPLLSYGGSSLLMSLTGIGMILSLSRSAETDLPWMQQVQDTPPVKTLDHPQSGAIVGEHHEPRIRGPRSRRRPEPRSTVNDPS